MSVRRVLRVFENRSSTGASGTFFWPGGKGLMVVSGGLCGTNARLRVKESQGAYINGNPNIETNIVSFLLFELPRIKIRVYLLGGSPSGVYVTIHPMPMMESTSL